ncbi:DUF3891 family protein [Bacillus sp. AK031]
MIIRETTDSFIMIKQHDHAYLSGVITKHFKHTFLQSDRLFEDVVLASYEHDRSWIGLDDTPIWDDHASLPYSFSDYPLLPKLAFYRIGLDEIERMNPYSCLLCSMHFCSFFSHSKDKDCLLFLEKEKTRQNNIKKTLPGLDEALLLQHFYLLQFSDNLSLYICLNEPGAEKDHEHPWFKKGFSNTEMFSPHNQPLIAQWINEKEISINGFPFQNGFQLSLPYKSVSKSAVADKGIAKAYEDSAWEEQLIFIRK